MASALAMLAACMTRQDPLILPPSEASIYGKDGWITATGDELPPSDQGMVGAVPLSCEDVE